MTNNEKCLEMATVVGEAAMGELPEGVFVFVTVFDAHNAAAAYGTGPFERTKDVLRDFATAKSPGPVAEA